ncbi:hypothetical protein TRAPUB_6558 [Trametes pubescens]|uniref:THH1/TOM1/TOM3 domain-containing protein n=1 Tax=Trametes pubescens TaxID=154538 RepID=A0A1M2V5N0_TRAPU|nr:hypothetical protein TRAPUB_6558 [Trametes pubescens]
MSSGQGAGDPAAAAAALLAALPPLDKMSLVAIWIETVLYGINVVVYGGAFYVLFGRRGSLVQRCLLTASTLLFAISTAHVAVSLRQLVEAFTNSAITSQPGGTKLFFLNQTDGLVFAGQLLYLLAVLVQDLVLIWRLYAVMNTDWRVSVLPLCLEVSNQVLAFYTIVQFLHGADLEDPRLRRYGIVNWSLHLILNIGVTGAIALKIWWQGRKTVHARGHNAYAGVAFTIMESGALFAGATIVLFALYINPATGTDALVGVNPVAQLATLSPLLIIARVGFGLTHSGMRSHATTGSSHVSSGRYGTHSDAVRIDINRSQITDGQNADFYAMSAVKVGSVADKESV